MVFLHRVALLVLLGAAALAGADDGWQPLFDGTSLNGWRAGENAGS